MARHDEDVWQSYAREQTSVRRRELYESTDVSGREALDFILDAIATGAVFTPDEARRSRLSSARRERAHTYLRTQYAPSLEDDLVYRSSPDAEVTTLLSLTVLGLPEKTAHAIALHAQGYHDHEVGARVGLSAAAVRQRLSRVGRGLSS